ncbi:HK97 family phage prohead protease [Aureimonas psammosilenae]|uniref:HK97 family phage prohead protease n=1 Tax=Aureimonas psammosilenae TaxID=2495496 RepID=UPI0012607262|nr:HK97 family phage prohead protease [Aureimonas psammosilenae]
MRPKLAIEDAQRGVIRGYASVFGAADLSGDEVAPGAFAASLMRRGAEGIKMLWQHDPGRPIGVWTRVLEDRIGLYAEGRLALGTSGGRDAHELILAGALDGLSIGFRTERAERPEARGPRGVKRRLTRIDLWEISVVTFPMQERARITERRGGGGEGAAALLAARIMNAAASLMPVPGPRPAWNKR